MLSSLTQEYRAAQLALLETCTRIETQALATNGRVRRLEQFKFMAIGAIAILNIIIVPIFLNFMMRVLNR